MNQKSQIWWWVGGLVIVLCIALYLAWNFSWQSPVSPTRILPAVSVAPTSSIDVISSDSIATSTESVPPVIVAPSSRPETSAASSDISLLVVGDIMLDRNVADRTKKSGDSLYPFRQLPENWISEPDLAIANLEGSLTDVRRPPVKSIDFQFDPAWAKLLKGLGWDVFSQANNHALDQGSAGYANSVSRLREAGFVVFGHQVDDGLIALATTTVKGETIAFLGWNSTDNPIDRVEAAKAIKLAKEQATLVISVLHWGTEYRDHPDAGNVEFAHWMIDQGVDIVIGGHPHWVQGISEYKGKPIMWSLGNFIFDQDWSKETQQGLALKVNITPQTIEIAPVPLSIIASQPKLETGATLVTRLQKLASISDEPLQGAIEQGKVLVFQRIK